jgi:hypothetical protein
LFILLPVGFSVFSAAGFSAILSTRQIKNAAKAKFKVFSRPFSHRGSSLTIQSANSDTNPLINGKNNATISSPRPTRNGRLMNRIFISGTMRANTPKTTISNKNAANIGAANLKPSNSIVELALVTPLAKTGIVGILPAGKAS